MESMRNQLLVVSAFAWVSSACGGEALVDEGGEVGASTGQALYVGVNGEACTASPYNCKLRPTGGNRVATNDPDDDDSWGVVTGVPIRDGNGTVMGTSTRTRVTFNYGQTRTFEGETHAFAVSTSNSSAGWMPLSSI